MTTTKLLPDEMFESDQLYYSYHFLDSNKKRIPNSMGYRAVKYLKPSGIQSGRAVIDHIEVKELLFAHTREDLVALMAQNDDPWIPPESKTKKKVAAIETADDATISSPSFP